MDQKAPEGGKTSVIATYITPGGPGDKAGIGSGDELLEIGAVPDSRRARRSRRRSGTSRCSGQTKYTLRRNGIEFQKRQYFRPGCAARFSAVYYQYVVGASIWPSDSSSITGGPAPPSPSIFSFSAWPPSSRAASITPASSTLSMRCFTGATSRGQSVRAGHLPSLLPEFSQPPALSAPSRRAWLLLYVPSCHSACRCGRFGGGRSEVLALRCLKSAGFSTASRSAFQSLLYFAGRRSRWAGISPTPVIRSSAGS